MIDRTALTASLRGEVASLVDDLRHRADTVDQVRQVVHGEWQAAVSAGRTAFDEETWREGPLTQVAVAWVLGCVFVRFCEDNGLLAEPMLSGPGDRRRWATDAQVEHFRRHPEAGERAWLVHVFTETANQPGLGEVFGPHNPVWQFGPSDDAARALLERWRQLDAGGDLVWDFTDPAWDTRFLGDLYQDLSEHAKKTYALLQTPDFVESFILDRTLDPAVDEFGLEGFRMIDPACGSGHFLLGSFDRLFQRWSERDPAAGPRANAARALASVFGVDLNPFAAAIARFRLLVAGLRAAGVRTLAEAPVFELNIAVGDSLLHGPPPGRLPGMFEGAERQASAYGHLYGTEDSERVDAILARSYHAVVANPPYITPKDPAANEAYRNRYRTCHRQYSLAVPFMERLFDLAQRGGPDRVAGFVGQITANSFMKREFGKKLIEEFLAGDVDLTHVVDTSGAYIPGHGTPTVMLFGRNRRPVGDTVRAVLGIRGEPSRPADPAKGQVWSSITALIDEPGRENDYVSVDDLARARLRTHPWSLQGGSAAPLKARLESGAGVRLWDRSLLIGYTGQTNADDVMLAPRSAMLRRGVEPDVVTLMAVGDLFRDWSFMEGDSTLFPYGDCGLVDVLARLGMHRWMWPARSVMGERRTFAKKSYFEEGRPWWEWHQVALDRLRTPLSIAFAFVATHNHFVLDRGGKVFNRSAPVVKLPAGASVAEHLELVGLLNSAVACFWMQQVFHNKGGPGGGSSKDEKWHDFYEFDGTKLKQFPIPAGSTLRWAERLDGLAQELSAWLPARCFAERVPSPALLEESRARVAALRAEMVAVQEELDWRCAALYGVTGADHSLDPHAVPPLQRGERAFEIVLARRMAAGSVSTTWFERHGSTPITELPAHWPDEYRAVVERRIELIESDRFVGLVERPEYKRRWNWDGWDDLAQRALRWWLLDRLEDSRFWPRPEPRSVAQLADAALTDRDLVQVAELYAGSPEVDLVGLIGDLVAGEAVPFVAAARYTGSGLRKRAGWERTWALQRREDAGEDVGSIPVPPKYSSGDFASKVIWSLRGKLDVPKERFISYPTLERETDPTMVVGWAGWDHLEQAQALAALYHQRSTQEGWDAERLTALLAGLAELVPWLRQWHNDVDPNLGQGLGDYFADYLAAQCHSHGLSPDDLAAWRPPAPARGRNKRKASP
jgi:hypothetical protein